MNAPEPLQESLVDYFPIDKLHPTGEHDQEDSDDEHEQYVFRSPDFDVACAQAGIDAPAMRARILSAPAAEPVPDPSEAAQAADQTAEPAAPAKPKLARKAKAQKVSPEETPEQAGSAGVDEGAEVTNG